MEKEVITIIDIGSNSVRERVSSNGKVFLRDIITCQLAKDARDGKLADSSISRTLSAVAELIQKARPYGGRIYVFATAAVRNAKNGGVLVQEIKNRFNVEVDVLSGEEEAECGILGALEGGDGTVIDVGGGSSELVTALNKKIVYAHSMQDGAVTLTDRFLRSRSAAEEYLCRNVKQFGVPMVGGRVYAIGGTANNIAFIASGAKKYDREITHGFVLSVVRLEELIAEFYSLTEQEIVKKYGVNEKRAAVIHSGALILCALLKLIGADEVVLSENDNLEGYYLKKVCGKGYEK